MEDFNLIETMLWDNKGYFLLDPHMKRLEKSAGHFSFEYPASGVSDALKALSSSFDRSKEYKVRLLLSKTGEFDITSGRLSALPELPVKICFSENSVSSADDHLRHKTTNRELYCAELEKYSQMGFFDIIFINEKDEITEGAITNVIVQTGKSFFTPPVACGLLPGTYREHLLKTQEVPLKEKVLFKEDLLNADKIFVVNSVRKMLPATL